MSKDDATENLLLWSAVEETNPDHTKEYSAPGGFTGTAINALSMIKKATEQWGPIGGNWGYRILDEQIIEGAPLYNKKKEAFPACSKIHTLKLELWYKDKDGKERSVIHYGHTTFVYVNSYGDIKTELEPSKKSLTDALKKALSMLGFSADIFLGLYDDPNYIEALKSKQEIERADDADEALVEQRTEFGDWATQQIEAYAHVPNIPALKLVYRSGMKKAERQCKTLGINFHLASEKLTAAYEARLAELAPLVEMVCSGCGTATEARAGDKCKEGGCHGDLIKTETGESAK